MQVGHPRVRRLLAVLGVQLRIQVAASRCMHAGRSTDLSPCFPAGYSGKVREDIDHRAYMPGEQRAWGLFPHFVA